MLEIARSAVRRTAAQRVPLGIALLSALLLLAGIRRDLPYVPEADEPLFVVPAIAIAASGDLNPRWFGHPGSTVIYPLAALAHLWHFAAHGGRLLGPDPSLTEAYAAHPAEYVMLGRVLVATFAMLAAVLTLIVGRRAFGRHAAVIGATIIAVLPIVVEHGQIVRTDTAAMCFGLLALWRLLELRRRSTVRQQILAGAAVGLAISTRWFMVALLPVLAAIDARHCLGARASGQSRSRAARSVATGALAATMAFVLTTPYFFLDLPRAVADLAHEARGAQLGADGLTPLGNLAWYARHALPDALTWPLTVLAALGLARALARRRVDVLLLVLFAVSLLGVASLSALHWARWTIQALPVLALLAGDALVTLVGGIAARAGAGRAGRDRAVTVAAAIAIGPALWSVAWADVRQHRDSTRVLAREWILAHVPSGSKIAIEWWTAPLVPADFSGFVPARIEPVSDGRMVVHEHHHLPAGGTVEDYRRAGFDFLVVSGSCFGPYLAEADRYPAEAAFYAELERRETRVAEFAGSRARGGPLIRIYALRR